MSPYSKRKGRGAAHSAEFAQKMVIVESNVSRHKFKDAGGSNMSFLSPTMQQMGDVSSIACGNTIITFESIMRLDLINNALHFVK